MSEWSLEKLLAVLHDNIERRLSTAREALSHPVAKGDASEKIWLELLQNYLPKRYQAEKAFVVDSKGAFSEQQDIVIFDRQYSPFIFECEDQKFIPAESVYAVLEVKQVLNAENIDYAKNKIASVRRLYRTSLPIPHAGGTYPAKILSPIIGGILTLESEWNPPLGQSLLKALFVDQQEYHIDIGCVAAHGAINYSKENEVYIINEQGSPAATFLFELIASLQNCATVPMIDVRAYSAWLNAM